jgi:hypothetical protein
LKVDMNKAEMRKSFRLFFSISKLLLGYKEILRMVADANFFLPTLIGTGKLAIKKRGSLRASMVEILFRLERKAQACPGDAIRFCFI